jgi:hypothetical protein
MAEFNYRLVQNDKSWSAEIIRKMTSKKMVVTMKKDDFASEKEADDWGKSELKSFVKTLNERRRLLKENK